MRLVLVDKVHKRSLGRVIEDTEFPQFWCKMFKIKQK